MSLALNAWLELFGNASPLSMYAKYIIKGFHMSSGKPNLPLNGDMWDRERALRQSANLSVFTALSSSCYLSVLTVIRHLMHLTIPHLHRDMHWQWANVVRANVSGQMSRGKCRMGICRRTMLLSSACVMFRLFFLSGATTHELPQREEKSLIPHTHFFFLLLLYVCCIHVLSVTRSPHVTLHVH